jgi:hypothetical protein
VNDPHRGIVLTDRALALLRDLDKAGGQKPGSLDALYANIGANYLELGRSALANHDRAIARTALAQLQEAMPHIPEAQRHLFAGPYEELHAALYGTRERDEH